MNHVDITSTHEIHPPHCRSYRIGKFYHVAGQQDWQTFRVLSENYAYLSKHINWTDNILMMHNICTFILINYNDNFINPPSTDTLYIQFVFILSHSLTNAANRHSQLSLKKIFGPWYSRRLVGVPSKSLQWSSFFHPVLFAVCNTIARGATRKIKKIQSLGALVYCAAPLRPQSAALLARASRFSSERRALY